MDPRSRSENHGILGYLAHGGDPSEVTIERPGEGTDRWRLGAHPDVVAWLWDELNAALPVDGRVLVGATASLVDWQSGSIVAVALGTRYAIRLGGTAWGEAEAAGYASVHYFRTVDRTLDLAATFGKGWVIGAMDAREPGWLASSVQAIAG